MEFNRKYDRAFGRVVPGRCRSVAKEGMSGILDLLRGAALPFVQVRASTQHAGTQAYAYHDAHTRKDPQLPQLHERQFLVGQLFES